MGGPPAGVAELAEPCTAGAVCPRRAPEGRPPSQMTITLFCGIGIEPLKLTVRGEPKSASIALATAIV
jgi:hypothetical protein